MSIPKKLNFFRFGTEMDGKYSVLPSGNVDGAASTYSPSTNYAGKISPTVIKAFCAYARSEEGTSLNAIADSGKRIVAEYANDSNAEDIDCVVYQKERGTVIVSTVNTKNGSSHPYQIGPKSRYGTAIMFSLIPVILDDGEAATLYTGLKDIFLDKRNIEDDDAIRMAILSENVYRRLTDENIRSDAAIKLTIADTGNVNPITISSIENGTYTPDDTEVIVGKFQIFTETNTATQTSKDMDLKDFLSSFHLHNGRVLTNLETNIVPKIPDYYVVPREAVQICQHITQSTKFPIKMRNFMLMGPAGTGKTAMSKAIASALGIPYRHITCNASTEAFDFLGSIFPAVDGKEINQDEFLKNNNLPSVDDILFNLEGSYQQLTGDTELPIGFDESECISLLMKKQREIMTDMVKNGKEGKDFIFVETDFIKAIKNGWLIEIQEPTVIVQPGALVALNSLLEQEGSITLPTGKVIQRHPDCVVMITTNASYEGCRDLNQSVISRMNLVFEVNTPTKEILMERAKNITGFKDDVTLESMVDVLLDIQEYCHKKDITDGVCGPRELYDWIYSTMITTDPLASAIPTVINKATTNKEDRDLLIESILNTSSL